MVFAMMDARVEMVEEDYLMDDHVHFGMYHRLDFDHRS